MFKTGFSGNLFLQFSEREKFSLAIREKNKNHSAHMYLISVWLTHRFHLSPGVILKTVLLDLVFVISRIIKVEVSVKSSESTAAADNT